MKLALVLRSSMSRNRSRCFDDSSSRYIACSTLAAAEVEISASRARIATLFCFSWSLGCSLPRAIFCLVRPSSSTCFHGALGIRILMVRELLTWDLSSFLSHYREDSTPICTCIPRRLPTRDTSLLLVA